jgi:hypothetical protein
MYDSENLTIEEVEEAIKQTKKSLRNFDDNGNSQRCNCFLKDIRKDIKLLAFLKLNYPFSYYMNEFSGIIIFEKLNKKRLLYSLVTGKWRQEGKNVWYRSKSPKQFLEAYVLSE